jgi:hypothetical protein
MNAFQRVAIVLVLSGLTGCSQSNSSPATAAETKTSFPSASSELSHLCSRAWRVSPSPYGAAAGSLYVFLPNGTLLETSCVETYRIATWTVDPANPRMLQVVEDGRPAFSATFSEGNDQTMQMKQTLLLGNHEKKDLTLTGVDKEFVCPDRKK